MQDVLKALGKCIRSVATGEGFRATPVPGVYCGKFSQPFARRTKDRWHAGLAIVVQGSKEIVLGEKVNWIEAAHYVAAPIDLPVFSRIAAATPEEPFLCMTILLDPALLTEIAAQFSKPIEDAEPYRQALFVGKASEEMLHAALRVARLFEVPEDATALGNLAIRETLYYFLKGKDGAAIRRFVRSGSRLYRIFQAIHEIRTRLGEEVDVIDLARGANMSRSAFFTHFREVTSYSPIQYQKRLRLLEARRLMIQEGETAEGSAFKVGYKSASQFSREYSRMFRAAPFQDAQRNINQATAELSAQGG